MNRDNYWPFKDLRVWQESVSLAKKVYKITASFPDNELYGMTKESRRASSKLASKIAEGKAGPNDQSFIKNLIEARENLYIVISNMVLAENLGYVENRKLMIETMNQAQKIHAQLHKLIGSLGKRHG